MSATGEITLAESLETNRQLTKAICLLQDANVLLQEKSALLQLRQAQLEQELSWLKRQIFGRKSEQFIPANSAQLLLEVGNGEPQAVQEAKSVEEQISYRRTKPEKKRRPVRTAIPAHLPRETEVIEPQEVPEDAKEMGREVSEILEYRPGRLYVRRIERPKYALSQDQGVIIGALPCLPVPKSNAGPGLLAHILISKFTDHLPFYRQRQQFKRQGVHIAESTMGGWFSASCRLLMPLYDRIRENVLSSGYIQADETPIDVLTSNKPGATHKGYHWVYHAPREKLVLFDYRKSRCREGPQQMLNEYKGVLQTDGYSGYNQFENKKEITLLACMAHARRKFDQAKENDQARAEYALSRIQSLYMTERKARDQSMDAKQREQLRQTESVPVLGDLEIWMKEQLKEVLPKSAIGRAIQYTLSLWPRLQRYTEDGNWEIDNNLIENTIRPVAVGRKNYLFSGSHDAAQRAAMIYSLLGSCKLNEVEPFGWLRDVLTRISDYPVNRLEELLPSNWKPVIPESE